jgi:hypothetical protein
MKLMGIGLIVILLSAPIFPAIAKIHLTIDITSCAKHASHIIVATEGDALDGQLKILESWKGDLKAGETIVIPELEGLKNMASRKISCEFPICIESDTPRYVTGSRMILFLQGKTIADSGPRKWTGVVSEDVLATTIWIDEQQTFAFMDRYKEEKGFLTYFSENEARIKNVVSAVIGAGKFALLAPESEDYKIYSMLIREKYSYRHIKMIVILDQTVGDHIDHDATGRAKRNIWQSIPHLTQATFADFRDKNQKTYLLDRRFDIQTPYWVINREEQERVAQKRPEGQNPFNQEDTASIRFSKVGFNPEMNQALVYVSWFCGRRCGSGGHILLTRQNDTWTIEAEAPIFAI